MSAEEVNPWIAAHVEAETEMQGGRYRTARALVRNEYTGAPRARACDCGGTAHYKATIGALKCPSCDALYRANGVRIR